jgi:hypothetical protein
MMVGQRVVYRGRIVKCIADTDSGNVLLSIDGKEVWTDYQHVAPIDGQTRGFTVFALPIFEDAVKLAA